MVLWLVEVGMDDPPPLREKFPLYPVFPFFFYRMSSREPKTKLAESDQFEHLYVCFLFGEIAKTGVAEGSPIPT